MPYDSVVSIGGHSLIDGLWRLLGPALAGLTNPIPVAIPGLANAHIRVRQIVPFYPHSEHFGTPQPAGGALNVLADIEISAEALLHVLPSSSPANIPFGAQNLGGQVNLPVQDGTLDEVEISGNIPGVGNVDLGPGTGNLQLQATPADLTIDMSALTVNLPGIPFLTINLPGIPFAAIVPVPVDLTSPNPLVLGATIELSVAAPSALTGFGVQFSATRVRATPVGSIDAVALRTTLQTAVDQIASQVRVSSVPVRQADVTDLVAGVLPAPGTSGRPALLALVTAAFEEALVGLFARTGRLVYPAVPTTYTSCDATTLPTEALAQLVPAADGSYILQLGFGRSSSVDIPTFTDYAPGASDSEVRLGNSFVLELLCCLVQRLPAFTFTSAPRMQQTDVLDATHVNCCVFEGVTAAFGGVAVGGGRISICLKNERPEVGRTPNERLEVGRTPKSFKTPKSFNLSGTFIQNILSGIGFINYLSSIASIHITFTLPLRFDLNDTASIANLRLRRTPTVTASVQPSYGFWGALVAFGALLYAADYVAGAFTGGWLADLLNAIIGVLIVLLSPIAIVVVFVLVLLACGLGSFLLNNAVRMLLSGASLLQSPVSLPPGLFEAFGRFSARTVEIDDLVATGVLRTPTSPWSILPRSGKPARRPPP